MKKERLEEIKREAKYAQSSRAAYKKMDEYEREITFPLARLGFELNSPKYVVELLDHIEKLERRRSRGINT